MMRKTIFLVFALFVVSAGVSYSGTVNLPQTGQTKCYNSIGTEILCAGTRQDGEIQAGVAWPSPRFIITYCDANGPCANQSSDCDSKFSTDVVTDNLTGLMWARNGVLTYDWRTWYQAIDYANNLNLCGYSDWWLPNVNELESFINADEPNTATWLNTQGFANVQSNFYWSSTTSANSTGDAWGVSMWASAVRTEPKDYTLYFWPVRSGQSTSPAQIWQTGQEISYVAGDDGDLERGVAWPNPRFTDNGNGTVADNLTGLMWTKDAHAPGPSICNPGTYKTWQGALNYVACLNTNSYLGHNDWRLPNRKELRSLIDYSNYNPALPSGYPFTNVQSYLYWSSTTLVYSVGDRDYTDYAEIIFMMDGSVDGVAKVDASSHVWAVRGGPPISPIIGYSPTSFTFTATQGGSNPPNKTLSISNTGAGTLNWSVSDNATWLSLNPTSGTNSGTVTLSVNISGLTRGIYNATITITASGATNSPVSIPVTLTIKAPSASRWAKTYGTGAIELSANCIQQTADGGYIVAASKDRDAWIFKVDADGNTQWEKMTVAGSTNDIASSVQQTSDGDYIVSGRKDGNGNAWLMKIDADGNVLWQNTYNDNDNSQDTMSIQQTADGGYIVAGETYVQIDHWYYTWLMKIDADGNVLWKNTYGVIDDEYLPTSIQQTSEGKYIVAGVSYHGVAWAMKLDADGSVLWRKNYASYSGFSSIQQTADNGYVVSGYTNAPGTGYLAAWVLKLDSNGNVQWQKTYGGDVAYSVQQTSDGGYIVAGSIGTGDIGSIWLLKLNPDGSIAWQKTYRGSDWGSYAVSIHQTLDSGYIASGIAANEDEDGSALLLKLDVNGEIAGCPIIGTSNAAANDTTATITDTSVAWIDTSLPLQTSTTSLVNTSSMATEVCFYTPPQTMALLSPNGSEIIPSGSTYTIQWSTPSQAVKFTLKYSINNGSTWKAIASKVTGTSYSWHVPILSNNKTKCLVKVIGFNSAGVKIGEDQSDSTFTIEVVKLTSPDGGETLTSGSTHTITWRTNATIRPVAQARLSYSRNGGTSWTAIKTLTGNPGSYNWIVPNVSSSSCKVKVVLKDSGNVTVGSDVSDANFTIQP